MKKILLGIAVALISALAVSAQSSELMSKIIKSEKATLAQISYLPALYANRITEEDSEEKAFQVMQESGLFSEEATPDTEATLADVCFVYAKSLGLKGGLFYRLFQSPRYAFKEFKAQGIIPAEADPSMQLSGTDSMDLFSTLTSEGEEE